MPDTPLPDTATLGHLKLDNLTLANPMSDNVEPDNAVAAANTPALTPVATLNQATPPPASAMTTAAGPTVDDLPAPVAAVPTFDKKTAAGNVSPNQTQVPKKQLRNTPDTPLGTTLVIAPLAIAQTPTASAPASITPPAGESRSNAAVQDNLPGSVSLAPGLTATPAKNSPETRVAFTAVLTPIAEAPATSDPVEASKSVVAVPEPVIGTSPAAPAAAAPSSNVTQPPAAQDSKSLAAVQPENADSDTPSQQHGDSQEAPLPPVASDADPKNKAATIKQDDSDPPAIAAVPASAMQDHSAVLSITDQIRPVAATQSDASAATATPSQATKETLRTSESSLAATPQPRTGAAQEITIRIEQPDASPVDLRVAERSGQLHVDVRTSDPAMQTSLREDLGTLTTSLQRAGYHSETFTPSTTLGRTASSTQTANQDDHQDSSQDRGGSGESSGGRRQQQQKRPSTWLEEMEDQK